MDTLEKVRRLVNAATGDEYGDGIMVTNVIVGYAEPGYGSNDSVIVLGNWNDKQRYNSEDRTWTTLDDTPSRLARSLERVGAEIEWCDEWTDCQGCYRAVRTEPDSYSWQASYAVLNECEIFCRDCLLDMGDDALTDYVNDTSAIVTWCDTAHVESLGYVKWEPGNEHTYESGWHPGQTDDPKAIDAEIRRVMPDVDVLFFLDEASQFYIRFSAYTRPRDNDDDTEE